MDELIFIGIMIIFFIVGVGVGSSIYDPEKLANSPELTQSGTTW